MPDQHQEPAAQRPDTRDREARLFDSAWGWLTAALIVAVTVAIIAITASVIRSSVPRTASVAVRPPADDPANPPAAAAPNTRRPRDAVQVR